MEAGTAAYTVVRTRSSLRRQRLSEVTHRPSMWGMEGGVCDSQPRELALWPRCLSKHKPRWHQRWPVLSRADLGAGPRAAGASLASTGEHENSLFVPLSQRWLQQCSALVQQPVVQQPVVQQLESEPEIGVGPSWPGAAERRDKAFLELAHRLLTNLNQTGMGGGSL